ncbi:MAG: NAD-dependent epimerase/dehydratase family protein [Defluviitaleaceae bacterium]|nr:NAD-dependent epimerase/dehydratase family protein [Defluviitaleaceae bacterium]
MNVLVLGGTRFMGVHLVNELLAGGHDVTIATRGVARDVFGDAVSRLVVDRFDAKSLFGAFSGKHFDVTIDNHAYCSNHVRDLLDVLKTDKYVMTSTCSVYAPDFRENLAECEVDTKSLELKWCDYKDFSYDEVKRQAENALFQAYSEQPSVAVRFPYIFGRDDYTKRLLFYVKNTFSGNAMNIDNIDAELSFIESCEAGRFLAHVAARPVYGCFNAASAGTISLREIIDYTEKRISKKAVLCENGESAPLNGTPSFSLDTTLAEKSGFDFKNINDWVYPLVDYWIDELKEGREEL